MKFSTKAIHVGQEADSATGATIVPIYQTSTYTQEEIGKHKGYEYTRTGNPTRTALEKCVAALEGADFGLAFASGLAATSAVLSILRPGDHVVAASDLYGGTYRQFEQLYSPLGVLFDYVDGRKADEFEKAIRAQTRLIWIETPTNPLLHLIDIAAVARVSKANKALLVVDNTFASPYFQQPLTLGADIVVHSTTKYIGGHSDVVGGAVATSNEDVYRAVKFYQNAAGGVPGPFDSWLTLRGLKTLAIRMREHEANAIRVAEFLRNHPSITSVAYPGLADHPQQDLAKKQMSGFGGMVTFQLDGDRGRANEFLKALKVFSLAESLGGVESLVCHPSTMTHGSIPKEVREKGGITDGTIRLSVGIEDIDDLIADLAFALA